jgi:hypothetical protein
MYREIEHLNRRSKLRDRDADTDVNRAGGWSYQQLLAMDARFVAAVRRALRDPEQACRRVSL